jgi:hypothetical protein
LSALKQTDDSRERSRTKIKDRLEAQKTTGDVLKWMTKDGAPNRDDEKMRRETGMNKEVCQDAGSWFTRDQYLREWLTPMVNKPSRNVLSLSGTGEFSAVHFCTTGRETSAGASDPKAVLRSLYLRLSWQADQKITEGSLNAYRRYSHPKAGSPDWEKLLRHLLEESAVPTVLLIDALDECSEQDVLLEYLGEIMEMQSHIRLLCSSRRNVLVRGYSSLYTRSTRPQ